MRIHPPNHHCSMRFTGLHPPIWLLRMTCQETTSVVSSVRYISVCGSLSSHGNYPSLPLSFSLSFFLLTKTNSPSLPFSYSTRGSCKKKEKFYIRNCRKFIPKEEKKNLYKRSWWIIKTFVFAFIPLCSFFLTHFLISVNFFTVEEKIDTSQRIFWKYHELI